MNMQNTNKTVYLIGAGMGNPETLTVQAGRTIENCQLLLGAPRLLEPFGESGIPQKTLVSAKDLVREVMETDAERIAILLSGDPGFYSGAKNLYDMPEGVQVVTVPGLSSVNYFCAKVQKSWQDTALLSVHGRDCDVAGQVQTHESCLFLTGGKVKAQDVCGILVQSGLGDLKVYVGQRLSYPDEEIVCGTAQELSCRAFLDLAVVLVENPNPVVSTQMIAALEDEQFVRGKVPMTKQTVRLAVLSALKLRKNSTVWDVGAGTGSVSVACALSVPQGRVYAIEQKSEATQLILQNKERFGAGNLQVICGHAPEVLADLPVPDSVFIGGSSGRMEDIFAALLAKNPDARIVVTAISLESLTDALACMKMHKMSNVDIQQISVANSRELGNYHMMTGENPVWVLSCGGKEV